MTRSLLVRLLNAYKRHGYQVRTGLNPYYFADPDAPFARLFSHEGAPVGVGAGLAPEELHFLELLFAATGPPANALIVGNAFGWSTIATAMLAPDATVVAMEAGLEGSDTRAGADLTHAIAADEGLDVRVVEALSPRDTGAVVSRELGDAPLEFVLIDGLHVNEQLVRDLEGVLPHAAAGCVFVLHDVLSWHMLAALDQVHFGADRECRVLTRCPSGMAVVFPSTIVTEAREIIDGFTDPTISIAHLLGDLGGSFETPGPVLEQRLAKGWGRRRLGMAATYRLEGRPDLEREQLQLLVAERQHDAEAYYQAATVEIDRRWWSDAEAHLRSVVKLRPDWAPGLQQLGRVLRERGEMGEARVLLRHASTLDPEWAAPHLELGFIALSQGNDVEAFDTFTRAVELDPQWIPALTALADVAFKLGEYATARRVLGALIAAGEDTVRNVHLCALAIERSEGATAAMLMFRRALTVGPDSPEVQFDTARMCAIRGDEGSALLHFRRAGELRPEWTDPWLEAFAIACRLGRADDADAAVTALAAVGVEAPESWLALAHLRASDGDGDRAKEACTRAIALTSEPLDAMKTLARTMVERGQALAGEALLATLVSRFPEWAGAHFERARALEVLGLVRDAHSSYTRACVLRPSWPQPAAALARLEKMQPALSASR